MRLVMLLRLMPMVERLCSMAEDAGCRMLIALGAMGILQPASSAMLHNLSTIGISLKSMTNLIPEEKAQKALAEKN